MEKWSLELQIGLQNPCGITITVQYGSFDDESFTGANHRKLYMIEKE